MPSVIKATATATEADPHGKDPHGGGAKLDAGKNRLGLVINGFALALQEVGKVGTYGANKYSADGWMTVPQGVERYTDAMYRHLLAEATGEAVDADTELSHSAHAAWNALARLDLKLRERERARVTIKNTIETPGGFKRWEQTL